MVELPATLPDPAPLPGVTRLDMAVLAIHRLRRFGQDAPVLPTAAVPVGTAVQADGLWVAAPAPGEWLVLGEADRVSALAAAQDGGAFMAVDLTDATALVRLAPPLAAEAIAAYSPIDAAVLAPGVATRTRLAELTALLLPEADGALLMLVEVAAAAQLLALLALLTMDR